LTRKLVNLDFDAIICDVKARSSLSSSEIASGCVAFVTDLVTQAGAPRVAGLATNLFLTGFSGLGGAVSFPSLVLTSTGFKPLDCGVKELHQEKSKILELT
jgi:hypothetical protein